MSKKRVIYIALAVIVCVAVIAGFLKYKSEIEQESITVTPVPVGTGVKLTAGVATEMEKPVTYIYTPAISTEFRGYEIPEKYAKNGGKFPKSLQVYLWELCEERGVNYYTVVALIERESKYKSDATGDNGASKGYMQIQQKWHNKRMEEEAVTDLYNPYGNIRVGLNYLDELYEKYQSWDKALMAYNMGEGRAKELWKDGVYSTEYSREILQRSQEIKQEIKQEIQG